MSNQNGRLVTSSGIMASRQRGLQEHSKSGFLNCNFYPFWIYFPLSDCRFSLSCPFVGRRRKLVQFRLALVVMFASVVSLGAEPTKVQRALPVVRMPVHPVLGIVAESDLQI